MAEYPNENSIDIDLQTPLPNSRHHTRPAPTRKHMGVATSDPEYLPQVQPPAQRRNNAVQRAANPIAQPKHAISNSARYLSTPKAGRSIFISRYERRRATIKRCVLLVLSIVIIVLVVWAIFLR